MRRTLRLIALVTGLALVNTALFAGVALAQETDAGGKTTFTYGVDDDVDSMNQFIMVSGGYTIHSMAYDLLLGFAIDDLAPEPNLATEVPTIENGGISEDGLTWTFNIREGMTWSDGEALDANDIAYTYQRILDEKQGCCYSYIKFITDIEVPNDNTLVLTTDEPTPLLSQIYVYIYPEHVWSQVSEEDVKTEENFPGVTSGSFTPVEWKKGEFMRLEANPDYWRGAPQVDELIYKVYNNQDALVAALQTGEVDFADQLNATVFQSLQGQEGLGTHEATYNSFDEIAFNMQTQEHGDGHPALQDLEFRKAIAQAVDKQALVDRVLLGYGSPGSTFVTPFSGQYHLQIPPEEQFQFNLEAARQTLTDAGYVDTDDNGIVNMPGGGEDVVLRYYNRTVDDNSLNAEPFITGWLDEIGIATDVQSFSTNKLTQIIIDGEYDVFHWGWFPDVDPDFIASVFTCGQRPELDANGKNIGGIWSDSYYCNPEFDAKYDQQQVTVDIPERVAIIHEMQQEIYDQVPYVVLWYDTILQAYSSGWEGFLPQPAPDGDLVASYGNQAWSNVQPVAGGAAGGTDEDGGSSTGVIIGIAVAVLVVIGAIVLFRRRPGEEDRA